MYNIKCTMDDVRGRFLIELNNTDRSKGAPTGTVLPSPRALVTHCSLNLLTEIMRNLAVEYMYMQ